MILAETTIEDIRLDFGVFIAKRARKYRCTDQDVLAALQEPRREIDPGAQTVGLPCPSIRPLRPEPSKSAAAEEDDAASSAPIQESRPEPALPENPAPASDAAAPVSDTAGEAAPQVSPAPIDGVSQVDLLEEPEVGGDAPQVPQNEESTLADRVRAVHAEHPDWTAPQVADHLGARRQHVTTAARRHGIPIPKGAPGRRVTDGSKASTGQSPWTESNVGLMRQMAEEGASLVEVARAVSRASFSVVTERAVKAAASFHKVTLAEPSARVVNREGQRKRAAVSIADRAEQLKQEARERIGAAPPLQSKVAKPVIAPPAVVLSPFAPVGDEQATKIKRPRGTQFRLTDGNGNYLHWSAECMVKSIKDSWVGTEAQLAGCRRVYAIARDLIERVVEKNPARS